MCVCVCEQAGALTTRNYIKIKHLQLAHRRRNAHRHTLAESPTTRVCYRLFNRDECPDAVRSGSCVRDAINNNMRSHARQQPEPRERGVVASPPSPSARSPTEICIRTQTPTPTNARTEKNKHHQRRIIIIINASAAAVLLGSVVIFARGLVVYLAGSPNCREHTRPHSAGQIVAVRALTSRPGYGPRHKAPAPAISLRACVSAHQSERFFCSQHGLLRHPSWQCGAVDADVTRAR